MRAGGISIRIPVLGSWGCGLAGGSLAVALMSASTSAAAQSVTPASAEHHHHHTSSTTPASTEHHHHHDAPAAVVGAPPAEHHHHHASTASPASTEGHHHHSPLQAAAVSGARRGVAPVTAVRDALAPVALEPPPVPTEEPVVVAPSAHAVAPAPVAAPVPAPVVTPAPVAVQAPTPVMVPAAVQIAREVVAASAPPAAPAAAPAASSQTAPQLTVSTPLALPVRRFQPITIAMENADGGWKILLAMGALGAAALLWRRRTPTMNAPEDCTIKVLNRANIGGRRELLVVEVGGQRMLLGVTPSSVQYLSTLDEAEQPAVIRPKRSSALEYESMFAAARATRSSVPPEPRRARESSGVRAREGEGGYSIGGSEQQVRGLAGLGSKR